MKPICKSTHGLIISGRCPRCGTLIIDGNAVLSSPRALSGITRWNIPAIFAALNHESKDSRLGAISNFNFLLRSPRPDEALTVLREALNNSNHEVREMASEALTTLGTELSCDRAKQFEIILKENPTDSAMRIALLGHYFLQGQSKAAQKARHGHIFWIIANIPDCPIAGTPYIALFPARDSEVLPQAAQLWQHRVQEHYNNPAVLGNAAKFFLLHDPTLSEELLQKCKVLEPQNPAWSQILGMLYKLRISSASVDSRPQLAMMALREFEIAYNISTNDYQRMATLRHLAEAAYEAGELERARFYASEMLEQRHHDTMFSSENAEAVHYGNIILGKLALKVGNVEKAGTHLVKAGENSGSPVLLSFGPDMSLAKELLKLGQRAAVVEFLRLCAQFWKTSDHKPEKWIYEIERGLIPEFGPHPSS